MSDDAVKQEVLTIYSTMFAAERAVWAQLVRATETMTRTDGYDPLDEYDAAASAVYAAKTALRALGVDVDALLGDG